MPQKQKQRKADRLVLWLHERLEGFLHSEKFNALSYSFILNPILLFWQFFAALANDESEGLSPIAFGGFIFLNLVTTLAGIKLKNTPMFVAYFMSFIASIAIFVLIIL